MTSMPASRSALAITLAPRSWPSRPGLATKTRIFFSLISPVLLQRTEWPIASNVGPQFSIAEKIFTGRLQGPDHVRKAGVIQKRNAIITDREFVKVLYAELQFTQLILNHAFLVGV